MIDVFISYAREDEKIARDLFDFLKRNGFSPWLDKENLLPGQNWELAIENAVTNSHAQVFLCSPRSVGKRGVFQREIKFALKSAQDLLDDDIAIIPYRIESCEMPASLSKYQWVEHEENNANRNLLRSLSLAAKQRGIRGEQGVSTPIITDIVDIGKDESQRGFCSRLTVPEIKFPSDPDLSKAINAILYSEAFKGLSKFRSETIDDTHAIDRGILNEYYVEIESQFLNRKMVAFVSFSWYYGGGAHGNSHRTSILVDVEERALFSAVDLFVSVEPIVRFVVKEIESTGSPTLLGGGDILGAVESSLANKSFLDSDGLHMLFDPYEIFCYAFGQFDLVIPLSHSAFSSANRTSLAKRILD